MSPAEDCIFCKIIAGEIPNFTLYEDADSLAFLDIHPTHEGHTLVIPKQHAEDLFAISDASMSATANTARRVAKALKATVPMQGLNLFQCNGEAAGQSVFHFHMHLIPREMDDDMKMNWEIVPGDMQALQALAERIKSNLTVEK